MKKNKSKKSVNELRGLVGTNKKDEKILDTLKELEVEKNKLKKREILLDRTSRLAKVGGWELDLLENKLHWTNEVKLIHEVPMDYIPDLKSGIKFYHPESIPIITKAIKDASEKNKPFDLDLKFITAKGRNIWVRAQGDPELKNKKAVKLIGTFQDITGRKESEQKLKVSDKKNKTYLENSPACTKIVDLDLNLQYMSHAGVVGLGIKDVSELYGKPYPLDFYPESFKKIMTGNLKKAIKTGETIEQEAPVVDKKGNPVWFHSTIIPVKENGNKKVEYLMVVSIDTTERNLAEGKLRESEEKFSKAFNSNPATLAIINMETRKRLAINESFIKKIGYTRKELMNSPLGALKEIDMARVREGVGILKKDGVLHDFEVKLWSKSGVEMTMLYFAEIIKIDNKDHMIVSGIDITDRKKAEEKLGKSESKYREVIEGSQDAIYRMAIPSGEYTLMSPSAKDVFGYNAEEFLKSPLLIKKIIHPDYKKYFKTKWADLTKGKTDEEYEYKIIDKDGRDRWIHQLNRAILDKNKKTIAIEGVCRDVTIEREAGENLRTKDLIFNYSAAANSMSDENGIIKETNDSFVSMWGFSNKKEVIGKSIGSFFADKKEAIPVLISLKKIGRWTGDFIAKRKDGSTFIAHGPAASIVDSDNKLVGYSSSVYDVSKERKSKEELKESRERYSTLANTIGVGAILHDADTSVILSNPQASKILGLTEEQMRGKKAISPLWKFVREDGRNMPLSEYPVNKIFREKKPISDYIAGINRPDRDYITWVNVSATPILDKENKIRYASITFADITEKKGAEEEIKRLNKELSQKAETIEEKYKTLYESSADAIMILEPPIWKFTAGNPATMKMFGIRSEAEFKQLGPWDVSPKKQPDGQLSSEIAKKHIMLAMKNGSRLIEWTHKKLNGKEFQTTVLLTKLKINGKEVLQATVRDVSEQKKTEQQIEDRNIELEEQKAFLNSIIDNVPNMIFVKDAKNLKFELFNKAGEKLLGQKNSQMIGKDDYDFFPKKQAKFFIEKDKATLNTGKLLDIAEEPIQTPSGERILHTKKIPVLDKEKNPLYLLGISEDITHKIEAREKILQANKELQELDILKNKFLTVTSHELKTPLTPAKIQTQMLLEGDLGELNDGQKKSFDIILRNINRLDHLIGDILEISRLRDEGFQLKPKKLEIGKIIKNVLKNQIPVAAKKKIKLTYVKGKNIPAIQGDESRLEEVLTNLVDNAIKFTEKGSIKIYTKKESGKLLVRVVDTGVGISKRDLKSLFQPFYQAEPMYTRKHGGTGLGLSIAKAIIQRHGGEMNIKSKLGEGSEFYFTIPTERLKKERTLKK
jgi:PAS domain S-box-containing protein